MRFRDREEAACLLAEKLSHFQGQDPLVLAIPRGAVPMGRILADHLGGELDVVLVRKLSHPASPELAIGSVSEGGEVALREEIDSLGVSQDYVDREAAEKLATLRERRRLFTPGREAAEIRGRNVIVLDDGVATGATFQAALRLVRGQEPKRLVAAMAVAPRSAIAALSQLADEIVCLYAPEYFVAVGEFFGDFRQVSDREVVEILKRTRGETAGDRRGRS